MTVYEDLMWRGLIQEISSPELIEKLSSALTQELDNNVKLGIKQDLGDLFLDGKFKISEKQVSEMYQSVSELIKLASDNKLTTDVLRSVTPNIEQIKKINYADSTITFNNGKTVYLLSSRNKKGIREYVANY